MRFAQNLAEKISASHPEILAMPKHVFFLLVILCWPWLAFSADYDGGVAAHARGDYAAALRELRPLVEQGYPSAQFGLGTMYQKGKGVPENDAEAVKWYRLAAEQGYAPAQYNLGLMYANGRGVPKDDAEAVKWFRLAAEQGKADAQYNLGVLYGKGEGVPGNDAEAVKWYRLAAEQGYPRAQANLGVMYANGLGVPENIIYAFAWSSLAARQGHRKATENKDLYREHMTPQQIARAQTLSRQLAKKSPTIGQAKTAKRPASSAVFEAGLVAYSRRDFAGALREFLPLGKAGDAHAQFTLGVMYGNGEGVQENDVEAAKWYRLSAVQGFAAAQFNLGLTYAMGAGVPKNDFEAVRWYRLAAEQGDADAQLYLGNAYTFGEGVPEHPVYALAWYNLAAAQGNKTAAKNKGIIRKQMTPQQIAEAQTLSRKLYANISGK
jgi:TPR repeat protein